MIRLIDIRLNAAHPELKLPEAVTYTGAPSTALIRGVPPNYGRWAITAVYIAASFPDGTTTTRTAVQSANGVWVATLPATATSGRTTDGFRVMADGIDENGEAVTGYILGVADFAVASLAVTPAPEPGETSYQMLYFDTAPSVLRKGDVTKIDGVLKFYNGTAWEPFAAPPTLDDAVTRTSSNGVKSSGIWAAIWGALTALPAGFTSLYDWVVDQLAGKLSTSGGEVTGGLTVPNLTVGSREAGSAVGVNSVAEGISNTASGDYSHAEGTGTIAKNDGEHAQGLFNVSHRVGPMPGEPENTLSSIGFGINDSTRKNAVETMQDGKTFIYGLGGYDGTNPTATGVKDLATAVNGKLASTSAAPAFSSDSSVSYAVGSHVTYNGKLYKCTTATTGGTWVAGSWTADTMTDPDATLDITAQNQLRVVAKDGTILWAQGYDLASTSSATLACDATNNFTFADGATTQAFTLPAAPTGKVGDFGLDIDNSANTGAATISFTNITNNTASVVIPKGENLNDMLSIAAGELARFYISLSTFRVNKLPTWHIVKQVVENGGAQS